MRLPHGLGLPATPDGGAIRAEIRCRLRNMGSCTLREVPGPAALVALDPYALGSGQLLATNERVRRDVPAQAQSKHGAEGEGDDRAQKHLDIIVRRG